jgi:hypothetical protein
VGYTHYWTRKQDEIPLPLWQEFVRRFKPIMEGRLTAGKVNEFVIDDNEVLIQATYETFHIARIERPKFDREHFSFCKTALHPYDKLVVAALILLATITKDDPCAFTWSSDGKTEAHTEALPLTGLTETEAVLARS